MGVTVKLFKIILVGLIICPVSFNALAIDEGRQTFPSNPFSLFKLVPAYGQDDWKKEFEDICSRTDSSMTLTKEELKSLFARCDALKRIIETLNESERKVYLKRLQMCRDLFQYALDSQEKD